MVDAVPSHPPALVVESPDRAPMLRVDQDGTVMIDWDEVERRARRFREDHSDKLEDGLAEALWAAHNHTDQPMPSRQR